MQRRLAAIMAADVVGYSRLMGADEAGTLGALKALRLNPYPPDWYLECLGEVLYMVRDYEASVEALNRMNHMAPWTHGYLAACHAQLGRAQLGWCDDAREAAQAFRDAVVDRHSVQDIITTDLPLYGDPSIRDHWLEGYRKAGVLP